MKRIASVIVVVCLILLNNIADAITVGPYRTEITISPGQIYEGEFVINNTKEVPTKVLTFPGRALMGIEEKDLSKWLEVYTDEVIIPPKESKKIKYRVTVPKEVKGEYAPTIVFREEPVGEKVQVVAQIRMPIYIIIKGTEVYKGEIEAVKVLSAEPILVSILVRNHGNVHVRPLGVLTIKKITREKDLTTEETVAVLDINKRGGPIFGGTRGDIGTKVEESLDVGSYAAELELEFSPGIILKKKINFEVNEAGGVKRIVEKEDLKEHK